MKIDTQTMDDSQTPVFVFEKHSDAEVAIQTIGQSGFDVKKLSLIGKGYHLDEHPVGFYGSGDRIKSWGGSGAFWGGIWGLLMTPAVFFLPGLGLLALAGPVVVALVSALEGAIVVGGVSALGAALVGLGIPKDQIVKYETALKVDKYLLMVHGTADDLAKVKRVLSNLETSALA